MKCKNCNHSIRSTTIYDTRRLRSSKSYPYTHSRHDEDGNCQVIWCKCCKAEPLTSDNSRKTKSAKDHICCMNDVDKFGNVKCITCGEKDVVK